MLVEDWERLMVASNPAVERAYAEALRLAREINYNYCRDVELTDAQLIPIAYRLAKEFLGLDGLIRNSRTGPPAAWQVEKHATRLERLTENDNGGMFA